MPPNDTKKDFNAEALLQEHGKDISGLTEKLNRCYSQDRYEDFQKAVKGITIDILGHDDGKVKIQNCAEETAKKVLGEFKADEKSNSWSKLTFWLPVLISLGALALAFYK